MSGSSQILSDSSFSGGEAVGWLGQFGDFMSVSASTDARHIKEMAEAYLLLCRARVPTNGSRSTSQTATLRGGIPLLGVSFFPAYRVYD